MEKQQCSVLTTTAKISWTMYINLEVLISHYKQNSNYFTVLHLEESF